MAEIGPPTDPLLIKTVEEIFDVEAHKPKDLIVQQVNEWVKVALIVRTDMSLSIAIPRRVMKLAPREWLVHLQ